MSLQGIPAWWSPTTCTTCSALVSAVAVAVAASDMTRPPQNAVRALHPAESMLCFSPGASQSAEVPQQKGDRRRERCLTKNLTEGGSGQVRQASRYEYARAISARYRRASKPEKGQMLDEFCAATGYAR